MRTLLVNLKNSANGWYNKARMYRRNLELLRSFLKTRGVSDIEIDEYLKIHGYAETLY